MPCNAFLFYLYKFMGIPVKIDLAELAHIFICLCTLFSCNCLEKNVICLGIKQQHVKNAVEFR